jgi:hypothetical protein
MAKQSLSSSHKNGILLLGLYLTQIEFRKAVAKIREDFKIKHSKSFFEKNIFQLSPQELKKESNQLQYHNETEEEVFKFLEGLNEVRHRDFLKAITGILNLEGLGLEWINSIINLVVSDSLTVPIYNLAIMADVENQVLSLCINPDTSIQDIKNAWKRIEEAKKAAFGKVKKRYVTNKSLNHIFLYCHYYSTKYNLQKENPRGHKITDLDVIGKMFENESDITKKTDKKRVNMVRQVLRRIDKESKKYKLSVKDLSQRKLQFTGKQTIFF